MNSQYANLYARQQLRYPLFNGAKYVEIRQNIAQNIKKAMELKEKSLVDLAEEIDVPISSLKNYASGNSNPRADTIEMLAKKFGITPAELVSSLPREWDQAETILRAAQKLSDLTPMQQEEGVRLFLALVELFSRGNQS